MWVSKAGPRAPAPWIAGGTLGAVPTRPCDGRGGGASEASSRHCRSQTVRGLGSQTHLTSALSPLGGFGKDTQPLSLFSHLKNAGP